jgi:hypothetical protein
MCIIFLPFTFYLFLFQQSITQLLFSGLINNTASLLFGVSPNNTNVYSDTPSMYVLVFDLLLLAVIITIILKSIKKVKPLQQKIHTISYNSCLYYLIIILLKYGLDKICKAQFYLPEPNTLFTSVGKLDKDILFWTSMGTSKLYNTITGSIEVLAALLLFFKRTRLAGILLTIIALLQVALINFSFDISVKLFSSLLLCISFYLFQPYAKRLVAVIFTLKEIEPNLIHYNNNKPLLNLFLKRFIGVLFLAEALYPFIKNNNFNDDKAARPYLHGAYEVTQQTILNDTLTKSNYLYKCFFIHRNGYIIFEDSNGSMKDFASQYDTINHKLFLEDYKHNTTTINYTYTAADSIFTLNYMLNNKPVSVIGKAIDWRKLPLLKDSFSWTSD